MKRTHGFNYHGSGMGKGVATSAPKVLLFPHPTRASGRREKDNRAGKAEARFHFGRNFQFQKFRTKFPSILRPRAWLIINSAPLSAFCFDKQIISRVAAF
jgi:hypothetical protein